MDVRNEILENVTCSDLILENSERSYIVLKLEKFIKRGIDIIGGLAGVLCLIPLTIIICIANRICKDNGPIFYTQIRIGKNGKVFKMYKYRSMVVGADKKLKEYLEQNNDAKEEYRKYKKLKNDPRVTKIGKFIRKTSLDEFPQFINVLKGDMSLVGPRPYLPRERKDIKGYYKYVTAFKPGITGLWQTNGRSETTFADRLILDMNYYYNHTLKTDIKILYKTIENVIKKEGAL